MDSAEECFKLRQKLRDGDAGSVKPSVEKKKVAGNFEFGKNYQLVGQGDVTRGSCGLWKCYIGCVRVDLHDRIKYVKLKVGGKEKVVRTTGKVFVRNIHLSCDKPSCPECFKTWAYKSTRRIEPRLIEGAKRFGKVEHIIVSVRKEDYGLDYPRPLRGKVRKILANRGVIGGNMIFHGGRRKTKDFWYYSPHLHILGVIKGGYDRCRFCKDKVCVGYGNEGKCDGFEARTRQESKKDGYLVKVPEDEDGKKGQPRNIGATVLYQLGHSTIKKGVPRFQVSSWFGVFAYRNGKIKVTHEKAKCPICRNDLQPLGYAGKKSFVKDRHAVGYQRDFLPDMDEGEGDVWYERHVRNYRED